VQQPRLLSAGGLPQVVKLKSFNKFDNTTDALAAATALVDSKLSKGAVAVVLRMRVAGSTAARRGDSHGRLWVRVCRPEEVPEEECGGGDAGGYGLQAGQHHQGEAGHLLHIQVSLSQRAAEALRCSAVQALRCGAVGFRGLTRSACACSSAIMELTRGVRNQLAGLIRCCSTARTVSVDAVTRQCVTAGRLSRVPAKSVSAVALEAPGCESCASEVHAGRRAMLAVLLNCKG